MTASSSDSKIDRRGFLKYVGVGLVAATAAGAGYYVYTTSQRGLIPSQTETTQTAATPSVPITTQTRTNTSTKHTMTRLKQGYPLLGNYDHWHYEVQPSEMEQFAR